MHVNVTPNAHILSTRNLEYGRETNKSHFWASKSALEDQHRYFIDNYKKTIRCLQHKRTCVAENLSNVLFIISPFINSFGYDLKVFFFS